MRRLSPLGRSLQVLLKTRSPGITILAARTHHSGSVLRALQLGLPPEEGVRTPLLHLAALGCQVLREDEGTWRLIGPDSTSMLIDDTTLRSGLPTMWAALAGKSYRLALIVVVLHAFSLYQPVREDEDTWRLTVPDGPTFLTKTPDMSTDAYVIYEQFQTRQYESLDVAGRIVLDIGANIGDSALFFAHCGAAHVYAFEPFPGIFARAERNVALNGDADTITLFNLGIGAREEERTVEGEDAVSVCSKTVLDTARDTQSAGGQAIHLISLGQALDLCSLGPEDRVVCKVDCEGAEFEIFSAEADVLPALARIDRLVMECHDRAPDPIVTCLTTAGFTADVQPTGLERVWLIWAWREG